MGRKTREKSEGSTTDEVRLFIPGNVPALKNNKIIASFGKRCPLCKKGKVNTLVSSKRCKEWIKSSENFWDENREKFLEAIEDLEQPYRIGFQFIRNSRHKFDYTNALDTVQDSMVHRGWLEDDNSDILLPVLIPYEYDKENPGVYITVL